MSIYDKWNQQVDGTKLAQEVKEVKENGGDYPEIPHGEYEVKIASMELKESKKGDPMFTARFKIMEGQYKSGSIFMNQLVLQPFQIHVVNEFLRSLDTDVAVDFDGNYEHFNKTIMDVFEAIDRDKLEYLMKYGKTDKGYNTFKIKEVFSA